MPYERGNRLLYWLRTACIYHRRIGSVCPSQILVHLVLCVLVANFHCFFLGHFQREFQDGGVCLFFCLGRYTFMLGRCSSLSRRLVCMARNPSGLLRYSTSNSSSSSNPSTTHFGFKTVPEESKEEMGKFKLPPPTSLMIPPDSHPHSICQSDRSLQMSLRNTMSWTISCRLGFTGYGRTIWFALLLPSPRLLTWMWQGEPVILRFVSWITSRMFMVITQRLMSRKVLVLIADWIKANPSRPHHPRIYNYY